MLSKYIQGKKVIIIDDSQSFIKLCSSWLQRFDIECETFLTATSFIDQLELVENTDAILLDYYLDNNIIAPKIIPLIRKINKNILIVVISGKFEDENSNLKTSEMSMALNAGANRVSRKQLDLIEIILTTHFHVRDEKLLSNA